MQQVKEAVAAWVVRFFKQVAPMTPALNEFIGRAPSHAVALVPGRMVDAAQDMLTLWQRNEPNGGPSKPQKLPVVLVAVARDVNPTMQGRNKEISSPVHVVIPGDAQERVFELRTMPRDYRVQLVFAAQEGDTAESLAMQFALWVANWRNQQFEVTWEFAGVNAYWPAQLDSADVMPNIISTDAKSLAMVAVDVTFCTTQPVYRAVGAGEVYRAADGSLHPQTTGTGMEGNLPRSGAQAQGFPYTASIEAVQRDPDSGAVVTTPPVMQEGARP